MSVIRGVACTLGVLGLLLVGPDVGWGQVPDSSRLTRVGRVAHPPVDEMSGLARSALHDNLWWVHNDYGGKPRLFAIDSTGQVRMHPLWEEEYAVGTSADTSARPVWTGLQLETAAHIDYEDIALDDSLLYIADIGNNFSVRRDLGIYVVPEPHYMVRRTRPIKHIPIAYPDQSAYPAHDPYFDAEALFVADGRLHILTKRRDQDRDLEAGTTLYRLDTEHPHQQNTLTRVGTHPTIPAPTAAALSPSGDRLAVLSYEAVWIFPRPADGTHWLAPEPRRLPLAPERLQQAEALAWDGPATLRITNEQRDVFVLSLDE